MKKPQVANLAQAYVLDQLTTVGELWHREDENIRCVACGHRCLIGEDRRGICKVRFVKDGELLVPWGYVAGLQSDPVEKKPFFHVYPGSDALTFGMLGCDLHCSYCFLGTTRVPTTRGVATLETLFAQASRVLKNPDGDVAWVDNLQVFSHTGQPRAVRAIFRHSYTGELVQLVPAFCPPLTCTPDHRLLAIPRPKHGAPPQQPTFVQAGVLSRDWCLAIPKTFPSRDVALNTAEWIAPLTDPTRMKRQWSEEFLRGVLSFDAKGYSVPMIASRLGDSCARVRAIVKRLRSGLSTPEELLRYQGRVLVEGRSVRLFNEHAPGIPKEVPVDERVAELLGYYCAEGCVWQDRERRANSAMLTFSFGPHEEHLAQRVVQLLLDLFGVKAAIQHRETTCAVVSYKSSLGLLFEGLCGEDAPRPEVVRAFLRAYATGDGSKQENGLTDTATVSVELAHGVAWLALRVGAVPSLREYESGPGMLEGRSIHRSARVYHVRWYEDEDKRRCWQDDTYRYIPIRHTQRQAFEGSVYNLEVEEDHTYLPHFIVASNCQNWISSQALRDYSANAPARPFTPDQLVEVAHREGSRLVVSSYNEPLITAEWAVAVFQRAVAAGLTCAFVSNGNATPEVLDYLRPWIKAYKVDLKGFDDRHYRTLGCPLESVTKTIRMIHERGIWLEVVTLVVPGFNDSESELREAARFLASVSRDIPWHVTGFHKDYKMTDPPDTDNRQLIRAAEIGTEEGLRFVYAGNRPGQVGEWENTRCPSCAMTLIERYGFLVRSYHLTPEGCCPGCGAQIPGVWPAAASEVRTGDLSMYGLRLPRAIR